MGPRFLLFLLFHYESLLGNAFFSFDLRRLSTFQRKEFHPILIYDTDDHGFSCRLFLKLVSMAIPRHSILKNFNVWSFWTTSFQSSNYYNEHGLENYLKLLSNIHNREMAVQGSFGGKLRPDHLVSIKRCKSF